MRYLLNAAMIPGEGTFTYRRISVLDAVDWLREHGAVAESYIGYQQTADHLAGLVQVCRCNIWHRAVSGQWECPYCGAPQAADARAPHIPVNRSRCEMAQGDEALVVKLAYRVADPATKGQPQSEEWEYGILRCVASGESEK